MILNPATLLQIAAAIQTISNAGLTLAQVKALLARKDITPEEVRATLDATDAALDEFKNDDA
jgi:hypothetical protein